MIRKPAQSTDPEKKKRPLTEDDIAKARVARVISDELDTYCRKRKIERADITVLDWGCGRGRSAAILRKQGYEAYGVDIVPVYIDNARYFFESQRWGADKIAHANDIDHWAGKFDVVFSEQVFEHVEHLESTVQKIANLTKPGGIGIHSFPGKFTAMEEHVFMPFVHWLPKNGLQLSAIICFHALGMGPDGWERLDGRPFRSRCKTIFDYTRNNVYYRTHKSISMAFNAAGLRASSVRRKRYGFRRLIPSWLHDNGFPVGNVVIRTVREN